MAIAGWQARLLSEAAEHGIWEARTMPRCQAGRVKDANGHQAHANDHMRRCVELIRAGINWVKSIDPPRDQSPIWPQGFASPPHGQPVPEGIDWTSGVGPLRGSITTNELPVCVRVVGLRQTGALGVWHAIMDWATVR